MIKLSKRLEAVASLTETGNLAADIGCDHGYVSIWLIQQRRFPKVIAMDVRPGPLEAARKNIQLYQVEEKVEIRLSDGLQNLALGEADCMICAGMGGALTCRILEKDLPKVMAMQQIILQPQSEIHLVRQFLRTHNFTIVKEDMVKEEGKYYPMLMAVPVMAVSAVTVSVGTASIDEGAVGKGSEEIVPEPIQQVYDHYGRLLLEAGHPVLKEWLLHEQQVAIEVCNELQRAIQQEKKESALERQKNRLIELEEKQNRIRTALGMLSAISI